MKLRFQASKDVRQKAVVVAEEEPRTLPETTEKIAAVPCQSPETGNDKSYSDDDSDDDDEGSVISA
jgi:hypothetical protein